jgi:CzcA family heavy metal efflux pump
MWIVKLALQRPHTFLVMALLIILLGIFSIQRTPVDILPNINIPVVSVVWNYSGLPPQGMANHITSFSERVATTTVNDIEHIESQSLNGIAVVKYFFQPKVNEDLAVAQITSISQTLLRLMPPGTTPPFILAYNASSVPVIQLALNSSRMTEAELFDFGNNFVRTQLSTVAGASIPYPYGGQMREVQIDLEPQALRTYGLSANDVTRALGNQNLILPAGTQKIGHREYYIKLNANFDGNNMDAINNIPLRNNKGVLLHLRDVAHVYDGAPPQTNVVRVDGHRAILMSVLKTGSASTINIISSIKKQMPSIRDDMPAGMSIHALSDQSIFVRAAIDGVIREGLIAAALTGLMILLFLGSWRSTLIITISIPLSVLTSIAILSWLGETINIMTLGGLALAVGILVDDATVAIENINWHLEQGKDAETAILDGAHQIAMPSLVSTLSICIVFIPMFLLTGVAHFLFVPLAEAVVFAMIASWILSRTLVPTLAKYWLRRHEAQQATKNTMVRLQRRFEQAFDQFRTGYQHLLTNALQQPLRFVLLFFAIIFLSFLLFPWLGEDFFPQVDAGQIKLHLRAAPGTRIEDTAALCDEVETDIRRHVPAKDIDNMVDVIGLPYSGINLSYSTSAPIGPGDADIYISLKAGHAPTANYVRHLRHILRNDFPTTSFSFLPADIVSQILNFGLPAPLDIQVSGLNLTANRQFANQLLVQLQQVPGAVDLHIQQVFDYPQINVDVNRDLAATLGYTELDVASALLTSLSGSFQTNPTFWVNLKNGVQYSVAAQVPQYRMQNLNDLAQTPITVNAATTPQILSNLASFHRSSGPEVVSHYNVKPVIDIFGAVQGSDMGSVAAQIQRILKANASKVPKGTQVVMRGQVETMQHSFTSLEWGLLGAIVLVYLLIVVNFQSWIDPLIIIAALPAAIAGIAWMLFITHTTLSVPALTGAIMCMGVGAANSILVISFARERMAAGQSAHDAALEAGYTRLRPVIMTALAMIIGMTPMAIGLGDGGEQNAPLGRAVIGGLMFATTATLFLVPALFTIIRNRMPLSKRIST